MKDIEKWDIIIRPKTNLFDINLNELLRFKDLLFMFVKRDVVTVYKQTILGPIWFFVQPLLQMLTFLVVFSKVAQLSTN